MKPTPKQKLVECREMLFAAAQSLYIIGAALKDREMPAMADSIGDLASMLNDFSVSIDTAIDGDEQ